MLMESERHLLKVMGPPSSSTSSTPSTPSTSTPPTLPPTTKHTKVQDNNVKKQMNVIHQEEVKEDMKHDLKSSSRNHDPAKQEKAGKTHDSPRKSNGTSW
ncbi:hypothetical protein E2C01_050469 [Portunus trituberculatus]|uniref:Uncharacterized protein n=1 Tax=Portunus trituberculatus TaxID=210409 RepID=A0A5B7GG79_PORTR|nr:hypothetical protein [Portunus trituberculatus]